MLIAHDEHYEGWTITASCREMKSAAWKDGEPVPYAAQARIRLLHPQHCEDGWKSVDMHSIPEDGELCFPALPDAQATLLSEARRLIDSLKR